MALENVPGVESLELIGRGGIATVHKGFQPDLDRWVAVKLIPLTDDAALRRFDRERRAMGRLSQHPSIATIYSSGVSQGRTGYLVMPLFERSLQSVIASRGALPWREAIELILPVADAVAHAHRENILHLDLKPSNILLDADGRPHVADFGLATLLEEGQPSALSALSPAFSSPEAINSGQRSRSSDVYGLGATLHTLLSGTAPYAAAKGDSRSVFERIAADPVPTQSESPRAVADVVRRALAKAPEDRWRSVEEFSAALRDAVGLPAVAAARPRRGWWIAAAWVAAAATVTTIGAVVADRQADAPAPPTLTTPDPPLATEPTLTTLPPTTSSTTTTPPTTTTTKEAAIPDVLSIPLGGLLQPPAITDEAVWVVRDETTGAGSLVRVDRASGAVTDVVRVGSRPRGPVVTEDAVWVFNVSDGTVSRLDRESLEVTDTVRLRVDGFEVASPIGGFHSQAIVEGHDAVWVASGRSGLIFKIAADDLFVQHFFLHEAFDLPGFRGYIAPPLVTETDVWIVGESDACSGCGDLVRLPLGNDPATDHLGLEGGSRTLPPVLLADGKLLVVSLAGGWSYVIDPTQPSVTILAGIIEGSPHSIVTLDRMAVIGTLEGKLYRVTGTDGSWGLETWTTVSDRMGALASDGEQLWLVDESAGALRSVSPDGTVAELLSRDGLTGQPVVYAGEVWIASGGELLRIRPHG